MILLLSSLFMYTGSELSTVQPTAQAEKDTTCTSLTTTDLPSVVKYLNSLPTPQIKILGSELGLDFTRLTNMDQATLSQDMVTAWLRKDDNVKETTWQALITALESVGHTGIASDIKKGTSACYMLLLSSNQVTMFTSFNRMMHPYT